MEPAEKTPFKRQLQGNVDHLFEKRKLKGTVPLSGLVAKHINRKDFTREEAVSVAKNLKDCFLTHGHRYPLGTITRTAAVERPDGQFDIDIEACVNSPVSHGVAVGEDRNADNVARLMKELDAGRLHLSIGLSSSSPKSAHPFPFDVALVEVPADDTARIHSVAAYGDSGSNGEPIEIAAFAFDVVADPVESAAPTEAMQVDNSSSVAAPMDGVQATPVAEPPAPPAPAAAAPVEAPAAPVAAPPAPAAPAALPVPTPAAAPPLPAPVAALPPTPPAPAPAAPAPVPSPAVAAPPPAPTPVPVAAAPSTAPPPSAPSPAPAAPAVAAPESLKKLETPVQASTPVKSAPPGTTAPVAAAARPLAAVSQRPQQPPARAPRKMDGFDAPPPAEAPEALSPETQELLKELLKEDSGADKNMVALARSAQRDADRYEMLSLVKKKAIDDRAFHDERTKQLDEIFAGGEFTKAGKEHMAKLALDAKNPNAWHAAYNMHKRKQELEAQLASAEAAKTAALTLKETELKAQHTDQLAAATRQMDEAKSQAEQLRKFQSEMAAYVQRVGTEYEQTGRRLPPPPSFLMDTTQPTSAAGDSGAAKRPATEPPAAAPPAAPATRTEIAAYGADGAPTGPLARVEYLISAFGASQNGSILVQHQDDFLGVVLMAAGADDRPALYNALKQYTTIGCGSGPSPEDRVVLPFKMAAFGAVAHRVTKNRAYHQQVLNEVEEYQRLGMAYTHPEVLNRASQVRRAVMEGETPPALDKSKYKEFTHAPPEVYTEDQAREMGISDLYAPPIHPMEMLAV